MKKIIDIENWNRKENFLFFKNFDVPFFGVTADVDFTDTYRKAKEDKVSFFLYSLHRIMKAANAVESFRYRIDGDDVVSFDTIHPSSTIAREDGTFCFSFFEYYEDLKAFVDNAQQAIEVFKKRTGLCLDADGGRTDVIHYSSVPWIRFNDMKHATSFIKGSSVPKISTGKLYKEGDRLLLPVSVTVNHALMDGLHVANLFEQLEEK